MSIYPPFQGFSPEAFTFLRQLKRNNDRDWFKPRKEKYIALLQEPMRCLISDLGRLCEKDCPEVYFNPRKSMFRIYRDTRFSHNKEPYKTHIAASFYLGRKSKEQETTWLYLHIEPSSVFVASGVYMPSSRQLRSIRESIDANPEALKKIILHPAFKRKFKKIVGEKLKRKPATYALDHPDIELLKHKQFYIHLDYSPKAALKKNFVNKISRDFAAMMPFARWVAEASKG
jgi:uncharacterized protein (TIGR02453 family)